MKTHFNVRSPDRREAMQETDRYRNWDVVRYLCDEFGCDESLVGSQTGA